MALAASVVDRRYGIERIVECLEVIERHKRRQLLFAEFVLGPNLALIFDHQELAILRDRKACDIRSLLWTTSDGREGAVALFVPHRRLQHCLFLGIAEIAAFGFQCCDHLIVNRPLDDNVAIGGTA